MAGALATLGVVRALVVTGDDGLDEVSASATTKVVEVDGEKIRRYVLDPHELGIDSEAAGARGPDGGTPQENAAVTRAILEAAGGGERAAAGTELAVINAGAAIYVAGRAETIGEGVQLAREAIRDGRAAGALERYVAASQAHAPTQVGR